MLTKTLIKNDHAIACTFGVLRHSIVGAQVDLARIFHS